MQVTKGKSRLRNRHSWLSPVSQSPVSQEEGVDEEGLARLRLNTRTGRPLGTDSFLSKIESLIGRRVRALPVGRPKKKEGE